MCRVSSPSDGTAFASYRADGFLDTIMRIRWIILLLAVAAATASFIALRRCANPAAHRGARHPWSMPRFPAPDRAAIHRGCM